MRAFTLSHTHTHTRSIHLQSGAYPAALPIDLIMDVPHTQKAQAGSRPITTEQETQMSSNKESPSALYHWKRDVLVKVKLFSDWIIGIIGTLFLSS